MDTLNNRILCNGCGEPLSQDQIESVLGNVGGEEWGREGYCSPMCFCENRVSDTTGTRFLVLDRILLALIVLLYVPLSLWGGSKHWNGSADNLPFIMLGLGAVYVVFESVRLYSPGIVPVLGALVPILVVGPSLLTSGLNARGDADTLPTVVALGYVFGLVSSTICWFIKSKKISPLSEWAFWMGVHSLFISVLAVPAIICGHVALHRLPSDDYFSRERARTGLTVGYVVILILIFLIAFLLITRRA